MVSCFSDLVYSLEKTVEYHRLTNGFFIILAIRWSVMITTLYSHEKKFKFERYEDRFEKVWEMNFIFFQISISYKKV